MRARRPSEMANPTSRGAGGIKPPTSERIADAPLRGAGCVRPAAARVRGACSEPRRVAPICGPACLLAAYARLRPPIRGRRLLRIYGGNDRDAERRLVATGGHLLRGDRRGGSAARGERRRATGGAARTDLRRGTVRAADAAVHARELALARVRGAAPRGAGR